MICLPLPGSSATGGTASSSRVGSRSSDAAVRGQAKVCTCTITGSAALFCKVTTPAGSSGPSSTRVGATLSEAALQGDEIVAAKTRPTRIGRNISCRLEGQGDVDDVGVGPVGHDLALWDTAIDRQGAALGADQDLTLGVGAGSKHGATARGPVNLVVELVGALPHLPGVDVAAAAAVQGEGQGAAAIDVIDGAVDIQIGGLSGRVVAEAQRSAAQGAGAEDRGGHVEYVGD